MHTPDSQSLIACHDCDLLFRKRLLRAGERATCPRCGAILYQNKGHTVDRTLIYSLTALILFVPANVFPFMTLKLKGIEQVTVLTSGGMELFHQGFWELGALVLALGCLFPLVKISGTLYVLVPLKFNRRIWKAGAVFRMVEAISPWSMMEVLMLGVIVAYVKLLDLATIDLGASLYSFAALIVVMAVATASLDTEEVWEKLEDAK